MLPTSELGSSRVLLILFRGLDGPALRDDEVEGPERSADRGFRSDSPSSSDVRSSCENLSFRERELLLSPSDSSSLGDRVLPEAMLSM